MPMPMSPPSSTLSSTNLVSTSERIDGDESSSRAKANLELFEALVDDIQFRKQYLTRLEAIGDFSKHRQIRDEIKSKICELEALDAAMSR